MTPESTSGRSSVMGSAALYRRLVWQARPYWLHLAGVLGLGLLASPLALLNPVPIKIVVDSVLGGRPLPAFLQPLFPAAGQSPGMVLLFAIALLVGVATIGQAQVLGCTLLNSWVGERLVLEFRGRLVEHVQRLSVSYHDSRGTADALHRIQQDAPAIQYVTVEGVIPALAATVTLVTMLAVTARLDGQLALVALAISPPLFFLSRFYRPRMRSQSRHAKKLESSAAASVQEALGALRVVKAFGQETRETDRFLGRSREGMAARIGLALLQGRYGLFVGLTTALGTAAVLVIGVRHVRSGALTLGQLLIVMGYVGQLYEPLKTIGRKASGLQSYLASAERAFVLLDEPPDVPERLHARPLARAAGAVAFRQVCFAYDGEHPVLRDVTFEVEAGTRVAIVGATGAGKTTLVSLLTRFYDPTAGAILLDGVDLRDYRLADLRNQFAIVLQEPVLFSTSIAENIAYGRPRASEPDIVRAAEAAGAHDFIVRLPRGYATPVGERGMQLSGGERQRVALARAFLKDAPLLILDEPTSAVDVKTEAAILEAMDRLMRGRTAFLITHRRTALATCDVQLQLQRGHLAETTPPLTRPAPPSRQSKDDRITSLMAETLEEGLSRLRGRPVRIRTLRREFSSSSSSFRTERLRVSLDGDKPLPVFFKDLNPDHQMEKARTVREFDLEHGRRELQMYQSLLSPERFGTLHLYASRWEPDHRRFWIFLEDGGRTLLRNTLHLPHWTAAARWAARFHAATRDLPEAQTSFLPRYDREHYRRCVDRVEKILPNLDTRERELVGRGLDCYAERIAWLDALPRSVIHGQFFGQNVMLRSGSTARRVVVIDWETAVLGPSTFDLVSLTSGKWTVEQRNAMWSAYFEQYRAETGQPMGWEDFRRQLAGVALYQCLEWLAWWGHHRGLSRHFANFMRELGTVLDEHFSSGMTVTRGVA